GARAGRETAVPGAGGRPWSQQDRGAAGACYQEALAIERELGDPARIAEALYNHAFVVAGDDLGSAARLLEESLDLFRRVGDERGVAQALTMLVMPDAQAGGWGNVVDRLEEVVAVWRRLGQRLVLRLHLRWLAFAYG